VNIAFGKRIVCYITKKIASHSRGTSTMSSLKKKAKTLVQIEDVWDKARNKDEFLKQEWVRLEDAQRELDNLRWNLQRTIISLQKELKALKEEKQNG
jgi:hypothetical protein